MLPFKVETVRNLPAGLDNFSLILDFWSSFDPPAVISLGNRPGAILLTRILESLNVIAIILVRCKKADFEAAYANCPLLLPFITPEILVIFTILGDIPGVLFCAFERSVRKPAATK